MLRIKRLYTFILQTFLPVFLMTFGICLFIVLMQFVWRNIDDMVGKGLSVFVLAEMFLYAALFLVPMALPLSILLASLMTFGNLGEQLELLAMKSAGVSLAKIMRPLMILIGMISVGAFFFQNNAMPVVQVKLYTLLWSIQQKSPELEIPEGVFNSQITNFNVYVKHKDKKNGLLRDLMIYDYSAGFNNARVIVADSGRLKASEDKTFLILSLYSGESFENLKDQSAESGTRAAVPYSRETFSSREILMEFDANFNRADESLMTGMFVGKKMEDLRLFIDSMSVRLDSIRSDNARNVLRNSYLRTFSNQEPLQSGFENNKETDVELTIEKTVSKSSEEQRVPAIVLNYDSLLQAMDSGKKAALYTRAKSNIEMAKTDYFFKAATLGDEAYKVRRHQTEWHKKFTLSFACLVFFFIGAPLGAIIRKGGLGMPVVISVFLFIFYYIIDNIGFKMARDGIWPAWEGMWLSSAVLTPLGGFLTYKAVKDSVILNADTYLNSLKNLIGKRAGRKIERKEVLIYTPDYPKTVLLLEELIADCKAYLLLHKRWMNYFGYWKQGGKDIQVAAIGQKMEEIVEELANSDQNLVLNKLMDYPFMGGYNLLGTKLDKKWGMAIGLCFPIGIPLYLIAAYQRKWMLHDMQVILKTSEELIDITTGNR